MGKRFQIAAIEWAGRLKIWWIKFKPGQGDEAADSTDSTARRGNAVLI